jgi:hypothetical protein
VGGGCASNPARAARAPRALGTGPSRSQGAAQLHPCGGCCGHEAALSSLPPPTAPPPPPPTPPQASAPAPPATGPPAALATARAATAAAPSAAATATAAGRARRAAASAAAAATRCGAAHPPCKLRLCSCATCCRGWPGPCPAVVGAPTGCWEGAGSAGMVPARVCCPPATAGAALLPCLRGLPPPHRFPRRPAPPAATSPSSVASAAAALPSKRRRATCPRRYYAWRSA